MTATTIRAKAEGMSPKLAKMTEKAGKISKKYSFFPQMPRRCGKDTEKRKIFLSNSLISVAK